MRSKWTNAREGSGPRGAVAEAAHTVVIMTTVIPSTCSEADLCTQGQGQRFVSETGC